MVEATAPTPSPELEALYERIEKGINWLVEHDPKGAFHAWWCSQIQPYMPMPAQSEEAREEYRRYHQNRTVFERLWREMEAREKKEGIV